MIPTLLIGMEYRILLDQLRIELAKKNNGTITKTAMAFATEASKLLQQKVCV